MIAAGAGSSRRPNLRRLQPGVAETFNRWRIDRAHHFQETNSLRRYGLLLTGIFMCTNMFAATDPFIGTWVYNPQKSPKPTIKYAIRDLGGDRYALTGSTGRRSRSRRTASQSTPRPELPFLSESSMTMTGRW